MNEKKYYVAFNGYEQRITVNCLNEMRNRLIIDTSQ